MNNIEGFGTPEHWDDKIKNYASAENRRGDRELGSKKTDIADSIVGINRDIDELQRELSSATYSIDQKLRRYEEGKDDPVNSDFAAEPLKDEQLRFSNYTYGPLIYYPVGCIFLLFLIYKKL